jgi:hypothetical protein
MCRTNRSDIEMIRLSASAIGGANIPAELRQKIGLDNRGDGIVVLNGPEVRRWTEEVGDPGRRRRTPASTPPLPEMR